jgi:hypothetical protein
MRELVFHNTLGGERQSFRPADAVGEAGACDRAMALAEIGEQDPVPAIHAGGVRAADRSGPMLLSRVCCLARCDHGQPRVGYLQKPFRQRRFDLISVRLMEGRMRQAQVEQLLRNKGGSNRVSY